MEAKRQTTPERRQEIREERELIRRCQAGEASAFDGLVTRYERKLHWIARNLVGDAEEARDLAQEAFLRAFRAIDRFRPEFNVYTWLYRIVVNLSIDHLRRRGKRERPGLEEGVTEPETAPEHAPDVPLRRAELGGEVRIVLDQLPPKYRAVLVLRELEELSCLEIAKIVGCTNATARWRLHRARELFRERWEAHEREPALAV